MGPAEVLGALKVATEATKTMLAIKEIASSAEARLALADLQISLAEAREAAAELKDENTQLKKEISELKNYSIEIASLNQVGELLFDSKASLFKCTTCVEKNRIIITLSNQGDKSPRLHCNSCKSDFKNPNFRSQRYQETYPTNTRYNPLER